jgi:uncharacterized phiE125 gp8 family phage protein
MNNFISNRRTTLVDYSTVIDQAVDVKPFLRVDGSDEDQVIESITFASARMIEEYCGISIGAQTREMIIDARDNFKISYAPVAAITSVYRYNTTTDLYDEAMILNTDYRLTGSGDVTYELITKGKLKIIYTCGYTNSDTVATYLPEALRLAWLTEIAYRYINRGDVNTGLSSAAKSLAMPFKTTVFGI